VLLLSSRRCRGMNARRVERSARELPARAALGLDRTPRVTDADGSDQAAKDGGHSHKMSVDQAFAYSRRDGRANQRPTRAEAQPPETVVPARYQTFIRLNPFTPLVGSYRRILLEGAPPDWRGLAYFTLFALALFLCGYWWFAKTRRNFADVI